MEVHEYEIHATTLISALEATKNNRITVAEGLKIPRKTLMERVLSISHKLDICRYRLWKLKRMKYSAPPFLASKFQDPESFVAFAEMEALLADLISALDHISQYWRLFDHDLHEKHGAREMSSAVLYSYLKNGVKVPFSSIFTSQFTEVYEEISSIRELRNKIIHRKTPVLSDEEIRNLKKNLEKYVEELCSLGAHIFQGSVESVEVVG